MGHVGSWRPETPNHTLEAWLNGRPHWDHQPDPSQHEPIGSPRNSLGGNVSSLSSQNSSLSRSQSRASLRSFFSRGRSNSVVSQSLDPSTSRGRPATISSSSTQSSGTVARAESPHLSRMGSKLDSYRPTQVTHAAHIDRARSKQRRLRLRPSPSWDPPPLYQAYPQSLKHTILDASCLPADVILRKSSYRDHSVTGAAASTDPVDGQSGSLFLKRPKEGSSRHDRKLSTSINSSGWTKHVFVLIHSGYLLQYAGNGRLDRSPEKTMQLGKDTVAFASDAVPGRHWVLQISRAAGQDAVVLPEPSKGLLSRIGVQSEDSRKTTENFLMVFNNADDLDSWLTTIRKVVEGLGGRQYGRETPTDRKPPDLLEDRFSRTLWTLEDTYQFPDCQFDPTQDVLGPVVSGFPGNTGGHVDDQMLDFRFWDNEATLPQTSKDSSTVTSTELRRLRDSKGSSRSTGTGASPSIGSMSPGYDTSALKSVSSFEAVDHPVVISGQLLVPQIRDATFAEPHSPTFLCHALEEDDSKGDTPKVAYVCPSSTRKSANLTPNFSVPTSSNRFSFFGSTEALSPSMIGGDPASSLPISEEETYDEDSAEADSFSRRPVSTIAPLPTPEALMNPTGSHKWNPRRLTGQMPPQLHSGPHLQYPVSRPTNSDDTHLSGFTPTLSPERPSLLEDRMLSAPLISSTKEVPAMARSKSYQGLSTFYNAGEVPFRATSPTRTPQGQVQRPLSLSGFPEPPCTAQPVDSPLNDTEDHESSLVPKPLNLSTKTSLPTLTITGAPARVNSRLIKIRDSRGVSMLGMIPSSGPPPSCPLPDTPPPQKRHSPSALKSSSLVKTRPNERTLTVEETPKVVEARGD